jgi:hypothetical protein
MDTVTTSSDSPKSHEHDDRPRQFAVRLSAGMIERLERHATRMRRASPGVDVRRSDALRALLHEALSVHETREAGAAKA